MDVKSLSPACVTSVGNTYASLCARRPLLRNEYLKGKRLTKCSFVLSKDQRRRSLAVTCSSSQKLQVGSDEASSFKDCIPCFLRLSRRLSRADS